MTIRGVQIRTTLAETPVAGRLSEFRKLSQVGGLREKEVVTFAVMAGAEQVPPQAPVEKRAPGEFASWRTYARNRLTRLRDDLRLAQAADRKTRADVAGIIEERFDEVEQTLAFRGAFRGLRNWLTGVDIERVWFLLHEAEQLLFLVLDDETVRAKIPELRAEVALRLPRGDSRAVTFASQLQAIEDAQPTTARAVL